MLAQSMAVPDAPTVWFEAVKALTAFLTTNEGEASIVHHFRDLLPGVIQVCIFSLSALQWLYIQWPFQDLYPIKSFLTLGEGINYFQASRGLNF
jgi:hypothetical protein